MFIETILATVKRNGLISEGDTVIAGVSGGPDSTAMLMALAELREELGFSLMAAHFNHGTRKGSDLDARFVRKMSADLNVPCIQAKGPRFDPGSAPGSLEERWRKQRHAFFARVARTARTSLVALAHTRDDQVETVLMRIIRGAGLYGLTAIVPKREIAGLVVIRPLFDVTRTQVNAFLKSRKIRARRDPTNARDDFFRNKIRNRLLPLLEKDYNPAIRDSLSRLAETAGVDYDYLRQCAARAFDPSARRFSIQRLLSLHPSLRRIVYRNAIAAVSGSTRRIALVHAAEIDDLLLHRPCGSVVDLPKGVFCRKEKRYLYFGTSSVTSVITKSIG
jgi:tRNA(Ile)-lysidine synthase